MLKLTNVHKEFKANNKIFHALKDISLEVKKGDIYGIIGLSGAGKTTLLRSIAGLLDIDDGIIKIDGIDISKLSRKELRKFRQEVGVVFQGFNLLMQKSVFDNIAFPLIINNYPKSKIPARVLELINQVELNGKENSFPSELSGGQKQRVAIARAIASNPKILLLDEVTSALDPITTRNILKLLKSINKELGVTMILITHEIGAVAAICNKVAVINYGEIEERGKTIDILHNPQSRIAKTLLGKEVSNV